MPQHTIQLDSPFKHVRLVPPTANADERVLSLRCHPETLRYLPLVPAKVTIDDVRKRRESRAEDPTVCDFHIHVLQLDGSYKFAGVTGYFHHDDAMNSCEVGILISPEIYRGGYATEALYTVLKYAFEEKKIHRITFETGKDNVPMRAWLEKVLTAVLEGERREAWRDVNGSGEYFDACLYSVLDREWVGGVEERMRQKLATIVARP